MKKLVTHYHFQFQIHAYDQYKSNVQILCVILPLSWPGTSDLLRNRLKVETNPTLSLTASDNMKTSSLTYTGSK